MAGQGSALFPPLLRTNDLPRLADRHLVSRACRVRTQPRQSNAARMLAKITDGGVESIESRILPLDEGWAGLGNTGQGESRAEGSLGELHLEMGLVVWIPAITSVAAKRETGPGETGLQEHRDETERGQGGKRDLM